MIKLLLVSPPYYKAYSKGQYKSDLLPFSLGYLASYVKNQTEVKIIDYGIEHYSDTTWYETVRDYKPDIVGFNTLTLGYQQVNRMAHLIRFYSPLIIAGGAHATICPEDIKVDAVVQGEGEITLSEIVSGKRLSEINGVFPNKSRERINDLDSLPFPSYELFNMKAYSQFGIIGSRGCPYQCDFCESPVLWNNIIKLRSPENIVSEIEYLKSFGVRHVVFQDDTFNLTVKRGIDLSEALIKKNLGITFTAQMRANTNSISTELFKQMYKAGCREVIFGIESGSNKVLREINKRLTVEETKHAVKLAHESGLHTKGFFMIGNYGESVIDVAKTWHFIAHNPIDTILTVSTPLPETPFYKKLLAKNYIKNVDWSKVDWVTPIARTDKLSKGMIKFLYYITVLFFHLPAHLFRGGNTKGLIKGMLAYING